MRDLPQRRLGPCRLGRLRAQLLSHVCRALVKGVQGSEPSVEMPNVPHSRHGVASPRSQDTGPAGRHSASRLCVNRRFRPRLAEHCKPLSQDEGPDAVLAASPDASAPLQLRRRHQLLTASPTSLTSVGPGVGGGAAGQPSVFTLGSLRSVRGCFDPAITLAENITFVVANNCFLSLPPPIHKHETRTLLSHCSLAWGSGGENSPFDS